MTEELARPLLDDLLVEQLMAEHEAGILRKDGALERRGKRPFRRPQTAIISRAAREAQEAREWSEEDAC